MRKLLWILPLAVLGFGSVGSAFATDPVVDAITTALTTGATDAGTLLVVAITIPLAFLIFKIGKRVIGKA
jgi:mannose/fructose/N-acetylgalactosamine-specific phosphotransferase system component IIC